MALISDDYDLIDFFGVEGETAVRSHKDARPKRALFGANEIRYPPSEEQCRERKRLKYMHNYHNLFGEVQRDDDNYYYGAESCTQILPSASSSFIDEGICNLLVSKTKAAKVRVLHEEVKKNLNIVQQKIKIGKEAEGSSGLKLVCLLLNCASAIAENNRGLAANLLTQLHNRVTMTGNSIERVAAHFTEALSAKLKPTTPPLFYNKSTGNQPDETESELQLAALVTFYRVSPLYQFAHFTANQAIIEAFEGQSHLHIIDFNISYGIQWASLIQSLSERKDAPALRITGFGRDMNVLNATGSRLCRFANSYGLTSFEFHPFVEDSREISADSLQIKEEETVAVNLVLCLSRLDNCQNRFRHIQSLRPVIVAVVEHEASHSPTTFLSRFMESLHYYAALFDSLDECLPLQSAERLRIETFHFGEKIKKSITDNGVDDRMGKVKEKHEKWETWKARMERGGFSQIGLSSRCVSQAKLLLQATQQCNSFEGGGFRVEEKDVGKALSLAWQDRQLILASAWICKT